MHNAERAAQKHLQHKNVQYRKINNTQMYNAETQVQPQNKYNPERRDWETKASLKT